MADTWGWPCTPPRESASRRMAGRSSCPARPCEPSARRLTASPWWSWARIGSRACTSPKCCSRSAWPTCRPRSHHCGRCEMAAAQTLYRLTYLAAFLSLGHHIDHAIRGNHVGWPLTGEVNAFTYSLAIYPAILTGLYLYRTGRVGPGFWVFLSGGGLIFLTAIHLSPVAIEPPGDIIGMYDPP